MDKKEIIAKHILEWYSHILFVEEAFEIAEQLTNTEGTLTIKGIKTILSRWLPESEDGEYDGLVFTIREILRGYYDNVIFDNKEEF